MTSQRAIARTLEAAGDSPIDAVEPRLEALEERLMAAIADDERPVGGPLVVAGVTDVVELSGRRRARVMLVATAASIVAVMVLAFTLPGVNDDGLVIAAADGVEVVLPNGSILVGQAGTDLPEGTRLDVDGSLLVDGRAFGPGTYVVLDGKIVPNPPANAVATVSTTTPQRATPVTTVSSVVEARPTSTDRRTPTTVSSEVETRPAPNERPDRSPAVTRPASTTSAPPATRPASTRPAATRPPSTRPASFTTPPTRAPATTSLPSRASSTDAPSARPANAPASTRAPSTTTPDREIDHVNSDSVDQPAARVPMTTVPRPRP